MSRGGREGEDNYHSSGHIFIWRPVLSHSAARGKGGRGGERPLCSGGSPVFVTTPLENATRSHFFSISIKHIISPYKALWATK